MSLARTATWLAAGRLVSAGVGIVLTPILARTITPEALGIYKQIDLAAALVAPFLILGFDKSITYFVPRRGANRADEISAPLMVVLTAVLVVISFAVVSPGGFGRIFGTTPTLLVVATAAVFGTAMILSVIISRTLIAVDRARPAALIPPLIGIPRALILITIAIFFPSITRILAVMLVFGVVESVVWIGILARAGLLHLRLPRSVLRRHVEYGGILAVAALAQTWADRIDRYLVTTTLDLATFAIFSIGKTRIPFLSILSFSLGDATAPRYSRLESEGRFTEMATLWRRSLETLLPFGLTSSLFLCVTAHWSIPLVFGPAYQASVPIFQIFAFSILLQSLVTADQVLRALKALRFLLVTIVISLALRIVIGLWILRTGDLPMLVLSQFIVTVVFFWIRLVYIRRRLVVSWGQLMPLRGLHLTVPVALIGGAVTWLIDRGLDAPLLELVLATALWSVLILWMLKRQGLLHQVLPRRLHFLVGREPGT